MRKNIAHERQDWLGRREVTFTPQRMRMKRFVPRDKEADLSRRRIRSWHETLASVWDDYNACILPEAEAMDLLRRYETKIQHEELKLKGAF